MCSSLTLILQYCIMFFQLYNWYLHICDCYGVLSNLLWAFVFIFDISLDFGNYFYLIPD